MNPERSNNLVTGVIINAWDKWITTNISNNSSLRQKRPGVPDSSDGCDGTSYPRMENCMLPIAHATGCIPYVLLYLVVTFTNRQKDTCVTLFAVAAVMMKPFTQCLAMFNHSYYLSFNDFQNLCIQFVFSSMYLCIYIATYLQMVYLDCQHAMIISNSRCGWRWQSSELRDTLRGRDRASLDMELETEIEWTQRCTLRPWSSEVGDAIGDRDWVNSEMHSELRSSEFSDALAAGYDRGSLEESLEVVDLEAVDGRHARCWDSIHRSVNLKPWECDEVTLPLKLLWRTGWWQSICREIRRKLQSGVYLKSREWRDDRQSLVYAVLGVCYTRRMLHSVLTHNDGMER